MAQPQEITKGDFNLDVGYTCSKCGKSINLGSGMGFRLADGSFRIICADCIFAVLMAVPASTERMHIDNLYKPEAQRILEFKWVWVLEKIHGTSAHISFKDDRISFSAGGSDHEAFVKLFDPDGLMTAFQELGHPAITIFGEAYGGKINRMSKVYGPAIRFVAFEVQIGESWLSPPNAQDVCNKLKLDFVAFERCSTDIGELTKLRDSPSAQAWRLDMGEHPREGIVLHPPFEVRLNNNERLIAKYKTEAYQERTKEPRVGEAPNQLTDAEAIAQEWVTPNRLEHVLQTLQSEGVDVSGLEARRYVIQRMSEDVEREGKGEVEFSRMTKTAVGRHTARLFKAWLEKRI